MSTTLDHCNATLLQGAQRLTFLPDLFSTDFMRSEATVYAYAERFFEGYQGGMWQFYRLPAGGGFMVPELDAGTVMFTQPGNWFEQEVSAEVAGIIITALVLNHRSFHHDHHDQEELCRHFCRRYQQLMDFVNTHPDASLIYRALD